VARGCSRAATQRRPKLVRPERLAQHTAAAGEDEIPVTGRELDTATRFGEGRHDFLSRRDVPLEDRLHRKTPRDRFGGRLRSRRYDTSDLANERRVSAPSASASVYVLTHEHAAAGRVEASTAAALNTVMPTSTNATRFISSF
jgi:hypothetical protein